MNKMAYLLTALVAVSTVSSTALFGSTYAHLIGAKRSQSRPVTPPADSKLAKQEAPNGFFGSFSVRSAQGFARSIHTSAARKGNDAVAYVKNNPKKVAAAALTIAALIALHNHKALGSLMPELCPRTGIDSLDAGLNSLTTGIHKLTDGYDAGLIQAGKYAGVAADFILNRPVLNKMSEGYTYVADSRVGSALNTAADYTYRPVVSGVKFAGTWVSKTATSRWNALCELFKSAPVTPFATATATGATATGAGATVVETLTVNLAGAAVGTTSI